MYWPRTIARNWLRRRRAATYLAHARELLQDHFVAVDPDSALELAMEFGVSAYEAHFLAVAWERGMKLTTEDRKLRTAAPALTQSLERPSRLLIH